jgi:choloylglycine hydrolase
MCTGIRVRSSDNSIIYARTLEFGQTIPADLLFIPRNFPFVGSSGLVDQQGLSWKSRYACIGMSAFKKTILLDGLNEAGLCGGLFYFPLYAAYQTITPENGAQSLAAWQLLTWLLTTCQSVAQVREQLLTVTVGAVPLPEWGFAPPLHLIIHDTSGASVVIEYAKGELQLHDSPLGVITNSPTFEWHMTNLSTYLKLSPLNAAPQKLGDVTLRACSQGSGMLGMPGDFTSPSRFVRAAFFSQAVEPGLNSDDARDAAFALLNLFAIPKGVVRAASESENHDRPPARTSEEAWDYTQWTSASDLHNKRYYWHTYDNRQIKSLDLMQLPLDAAAVQRFEQ